MKPPTSHLDLLYNIQVAIERIETHVRSAESPAAIEDAVIFNLIVIGEAASKLPAEFREAHTHIAWQNMIGMRHRLVHAYFIIDPRMVWDTVNHNLPKLKQDIQLLLTTLEGSNHG